MNETRRDILDLRPESLAKWLAEQGEQAYRLGQVMKWLCVERVGSFDEMSDIPERLRTRLSAAFRVSSLVEAGRLISSDAATEKFVFELRDGETIESVAMRDRERLTFCISSQAGCALKCGFCATGAAGWRRDLAVGEILGQVTALARATGGLSNVVFMGMGEPLLNLDAVLPAIEALADAGRFGLSARRITVSTAGVTPGIEKLGKSRVRPNLALSLNSPFDEQRAQLMPIAKRYPLPDLIEACANYAERSGRRVSIEYVLIADVNSSIAAARATARIARRLAATVNVIAFNPVAGCGFGPPSKEEMRRFKSSLESEGATVTERFRRGRDIAAGCGQLGGRRKTAVSGQ